MTLLDQAHRYVIPLIKQMPHLPRGQRMHTITDDECDFGLDQWHGSR